MNPRQLVENEKINAEPPGTGPKFLPIDLKTLW